VAADPVDLDSMGPGYFAGQTADSENLYQLNEPPTPPDEIGAMLDAAIEEGPRDIPLIDPEKPQRTETKTTPPAADEWLDLFSRVVLKVGIDLYIDFAFRGIDDSLVSEADLRRIQVKREERESIARPFAEFCAKNATTRKYGRQIVALTDSAESLVTLGIWTRRVNRVARKYRPAKTPRNVLRPQAHIRESNADIGQNAGTGPNGNQPGGYTIYNPGAG
jgi:hypothetical protein